MKIRFLVFQCEFSCGIVHLLFCLPLYFLCLPLLNGILGLLASFHAIFLRYPNRCDFYMQFACSFTSFWFFFSSLMETYCVGDFQSVVSWRTRCHGSIVRAMNVIGAALALLMFAATVFGIFCWFQRNSPAQSISRHCHWMPKTEEYCLRIIIYIFLFAFSFLQFVFSMKSAFTAKLTELYY
ncbi:unnamed protein product [Nippostrongylus brasiliensis]|uniref:CASP-like protein n=1 Tax=Nippostrongylus brasiliensis TaxID=27835 RepID=A0A158R3P1_NIPBR|nr:unnamed protein product [Nippostrongylus brasiliensis]